MLINLSIFHNNEKESYSNISNIVNNPKNKKSDILSDGKLSRSLINEKDSNIESNKINTNLNEEDYDLSIPSTNSRESFFNKLSAPKKIKNKIVIDSSIMNKNFIKVLNKINKHNVNKYKEKHVKEHEINTRKTIKKLEILNLKIVDYIEEVKERDAVLVNTLKHERSEDL